MNAELLVNVLDMSRHRVLRDEQLLANIGAAATLSQEKRYLGLAIGQTEALLQAQAAFHQRTLHRVRPDKLIGIFSRLTGRRHDAGKRDQADEQQSHRGKRHARGNAQLAANVSHEHPPPAPRR